MYIPSQGLRAVQDEHVRWHLEQAAQRRMIKEAALERDSVALAPEEMPSVGALTVLIQRARRQLTSKRSRQAAPRLRA